MNKALLEYEMKIKNVSKDELSEKLGMSRSALYRKLSGKSHFTISEAQNIINILNLQSPCDIFFDN